MNYPAPKFRLFAIYFYDTEAGMLFPDSFHVASINGKGD